MARFPYLSCGKLAKSYLSFAQEMQLNVNIFCSVWIQVDVGNGNKVLVGAYYRSNIDNQHSFDELGLSLQKLNEIKKYDT